MSRLNGFYKVKHHGKEEIMLWTSTNGDNTCSISGFWKGKNAYSGNDHDMQFIDEKKLSDNEVLNLINKTPTQ